MLKDFNRAGPTVILVATCLAVALLSLQLVGFPPALGRPEVALSAGYFAYALVLAASAGAALKSVKGEGDTALVPLRWTLLCLAALCVLHIGARFMPPAASLYADPGTIAVRYFLARSLATTQPLVYLLAVSLFASFLARGRLRAFLSNWLTASALLYLLALLGAAHMMVPMYRTGDHLTILAAVVPLAVCGLLLAWAMSLNRAVAGLVWPRGMPPYVDEIDRNNRRYLWLLGATMPWFASAASILLGVVLVWAVFYLVIGRLKFVYSAKTAWIAISSVFYMGSMMVSLYLNGGKDVILENTIRLAPFLIIFLLGPRYWRSPVPVNIPYLAQGAAVGVYIFSVMALYEFVVIGSYGPYGARVNVLSGNPVPAAYMIVVCSLIAALGLDRLSPVQRRFRGGAVAAGFSTAMLTGSISVLASLPVLLLLLVWRYRTLLASLARTGWQVSGMSKALFAAALLAVALAVAASPLWQRASNYFEAAIETEHSGEAIALNQRITMWDAGLAAAAGAPFIGYGPQNRFEAIRSYLPPEAVEKIRYTHPHNGFLAAMLAGGLPGLLSTIMLLAAPVIVAWRHVSRPWRDDILMLATGTAFVYVTAGMGGIMFFHDATDSLFCWVMLIVAIHAAPEKTPKAAGHASTALPTYQS